MGGQILIADCGDSAVVVKAEGANAWETVHTLADAIEAARLDGVYGIVPTYDSLLVEFDCTDTDHDTVRDALTHEIGRLAESPIRRLPARRFVVPVVYGGEYGPDLPVVAEQLGLTEQDVVRLHAGTDLTVRCLGAPAGAPMTDGPAFPRPVPRLASPRTSVPPGSVAVAGRQAVICPMRSPGGWPLLGRTPLRVLDLDSEPLTPYRPGDTFRFVPITPERWDEYDGLALAAATWDEYDGLALAPDGLAPVPTGGTHG
ncbi:allophanate hydrolase subunit 1 [Streptomyces sp. NBC_00620]|uniref:5-oxoprolinase subunit B family protein n=1 Tax=Streptomyces sp. NBC_00620 TaxID=2903666 RepID=UPI00225997EF|nr:carboxyltransferase domain-containing protein [Streptomyces sp. NBC_00620]MCX4978133.1 allophanate hydrolase subunit 1 [Streptomyces sp. NBC_00620]